MNEHRDNLCDNWTVWIRFGYWPTHIHDDCTSWNQIGVSLKKWLNLVNWEFGVRYVIKRRWIMRVDRFGGCVGMLKLGDFHGSTLTYAMVILVSLDPLWADVLCAWDYTSWLCWFRVPLCYFVNMVYWPVHWNCIAHVSYCVLLLWIDPWVIFKKK